MNPLFAATPTGVELAGWLGCFGFLLMIVINTLKLTDRFKEKPPPSQTYATIKGVEQIDHRLTGEINEVKQDVSNLKDSIVKNGDARRVAIETKVENARTEARNDNTTLRNEVNALAQNVAKVQTIAEQTHTDVKLLSQELRSAK